MRLDIKVCLSILSKRDTRHAILPFLSKFVSSPEINRDCSVFTCLLYCRYQKESSSNDTPVIPPTTDYQFTSVNIFKELFNLHNRKEPTDLSSRIANAGVVLLCEFTQINIEGKCKLLNYSRQMRYIRMDTKYGKCREGLAKVS